MTLLVITPGKNVDHDAVFNLLVAETGEHLASHFCSHWCFAMSDLYSGRPERIAKWAERFGEMEVKFIEDADLTVEELLSRNKLWFQSLPEEEKKNVS